MVKYEWLLLKSHFYHLIGFVSGLKSSVASYLVRKGPHTWCSACGYSSHFPRNVTRHIESKHLNIDITCKFCGSKMKTSRSLNEHLKKYHPESLANIREIMKWHLEDVTIS